MLTLTLRYSLLLFSILLAMALLLIGMARSSTAYAAELALYSRRSGNFEIYRADTGRGLAINLTKNPADDVRPAWSPDGERLAFFSERDEQRGLYVMGAEGQKPRLIVPSAQGEAYPAWTPDGRFVTYTDYGAASVGIYQVEVECAPDCAPRLLTEHRASLLAWSPDGRYLTFIADCENNCDIYILDPAGEAHAITRNGVFDVFPAWSPDGQSLAYMSNRDDFFELYVVEMGCIEQGWETCERSSRRLTENLDFDGFPAWSPDGDSIIFSADRDSNFDLYIVAADCEADCAEQTVQFTDHAARDLSPAWSPDGQTIAYISGRGVYVLGIQCVPESESCSSRMVMSDVLPDQFLLWRP